MKTLYHVDSSGAMGKPVLVPLSAAAAVCILCDAAAGTTSTAVVALCMTQRRALSAQVICDYVNSRC